jgi:two-component system, cell cycle response regulator
MADYTRALAAFNILPIGFTSQEKTMIETFFALASRRAPHWALTAAASEARVILFNASSQQDVDTFKSLVAHWQHVVIVGASDFGTGWAVMPRPLKLTAILTVLNEVVKTAVPVAKPKPQLVAVAQAMTKVVAPVSEVEILANTSLKNTHDALGRVLIVDDSDIALKYMQNRLRYFGYESELAKSGEEALALVGQHSYHFVFLDVMMEGIDGYKTCRAIKNNKARRGPAPVVVMLTSRGGTIDKIRGAMAGCDAYLTKPLNEKQLALVLAKYDESTALQRWDAVHPHEPLVDTFAPKLNLKL